VTFMTVKAVISDVSDTALWVASLRGQEGERADAVFHDPLATLLAGTRGRKIARSVPRRSLMAWAIAVRTSAIDLLITQALGLGVDTVLNLGAGLDARPYRMSLPPHLRWIEVDFPHIVAFKDTELRAHKPSCRVERVGLDLLDLPSRNALLAQYGLQSETALVIAEGVIPYFSNEAVAILAAELASIPSFRHWIMDFDNAGVRRVPRAWARQMQSAPFVFQAADWFRFVERCGWQPARVVTSAEQSERINRPYPLHFPLGFLMRALPAATRHKILSLSGAVLLRKQCAG
jgi:methyltransferase (TIGR00027 family)